MRMFEGMVSHCGDPIASPLSPSDTKGAGNGHFSAASNRNTNVYYGGSCWLLKEPPFRPIVNIIFHFLRVDHCCSFFFFFLSLKFTLDAVKMKRIRVRKGEVFLGQSRTPTLGSPESASCNQEMRGGGRSFSPSYSSPTPTHHPTHHHHKNDSNRLLILSSKWLIKAFQSSSSPVLSANIIPTALCLIA